MKYLKLLNLLSYLYKKGNVFMKISTFGLIFLSLLTYHTNSYSQSGENLHAGYYIVVSAYSPSRESMAQQYVGKLRSEGFKADYGMDTRPHLYLVYIHYYDDFREAIREMLKTRRGGEFTDAWVRVIPGDIPREVPEKIDKETTAGAEKTAKEKEQEVTAEKQEADVEEKEEEIEAEAVIEEAEKSHTQAKAQKVYINLFYVTRNRIVDGYVQIIDTERGKMIKRVKGNAFVYLPDPGTSTERLSLIADIFGYRKMQLDVVYPLTKKNTADLPYVEWVEGIPAINFELDRYHKGDVAVMYNVYFYNDAAIMLPKSKYELNSLLEMLKENPNYRIRLHGHTNTNRPGKIISMGPDKNFFAVTDQSVHTTGSAKKLSGMRAETIRQYLIEKGIDPGRIETKAWGGKKPLYEPHSPSAKKNVRVEVEILAE